MARDQLVSDLGRHGGQLHHRLRDLTPVVSEDLRNAWHQSARAALERRPAARMPKEADYGPEQFLVLVTCRDEGHQVELLGRFQKEGLECKALLS